MHGKPNQTNPGTSSLPANPLDAAGALLFISGDPIGYHRNNLIWLRRVVGFQMDSKVMQAVHTFVHHKSGRSDLGAFTGLEYHRTDGQARRSAPLAHFDVWLFFEPERPLTNVGDLDFESQVGVEFDIAIIDHFLIHSQSGSAAAVTVAKCDEQGSRNQQHTPANHQGQRADGLLWFLRPFLYFLLI